MTFIDIKSIQISWKLLSYIKFWKGARAHTQHGDLFKVYSPLKEDRDELSENTMHALLSYVEGYFVCFILILRRFIQLFQRLEDFRYLFSKLFRLHKENNLLEEDGFSSPHSSHFNLCFETEILN